MGRIGYCPNCGTPLHPGFYFCLGCATPYKPPDSVLPVVRPPSMFYEQLIQRKAPHVMPVFWTYLFVVLGSAVLSLMLSLDRREDMAIFVGSVALFVTTCVFAAWHWRVLAVQFRRFGFLRWEAWAAKARPCLTSWSASASPTAC